MWLLDFIFGIHCDQLLTWTLRPALMAGVQSLDPVISCPSWHGAAGHIIGHLHYNDVIMSTLASQITGLTIVYSTVYSVADPRKHQSSASLVFVRGIHRWPVNSPRKGPVTRNMFPFDDVIMWATIYIYAHCYIMDLQWYFWRPLVFTYRWLSARLQYFQCVSIGGAAVLQINHW